MRSARCSTSLELVGAKDIFRQENDTNHLAGTARMGFDTAGQCGQFRLPQLGYSRICGSATALYFRRRGASIRR